MVTRLSTVCRLILSLYGLVDVVYPDYSYWVAVEAVFFNEGRDAEPV
jgi:hypothetical protein